MPNPRLLFLSQCLPYPPHSGVTNRTFNIARQLALGFEVDILAFSRRNHQADEKARGAAVEALRRELGAGVHAIPIPGEVSVLSRAGVHARSVLSRKPYTWYEYMAPGFAAHLEQAIVSRPPALVHMDSLDLARWLPCLTGTPVAVTHHSIESELLRLRARHHSSRYVARYLYHQADLVERVEAEWAPRVAMNVMMSEVDAERLKALAPGARTMVAPNGVDTAAMVPDQDATVDPHRIVFLGPTYMFPNRDGLEYFFGEIWDQIRAKVPDATISLIGKNGPADHQRYAAIPGVTPMGYVPDIRPGFARAACSIVPLRVGGGTRLKILDAWALGKAVVSTSVGCEGLDARNGQNILIADEPVTFADAVIAVLQDASLRRQLEQDARRTVVQRYSWERIGSDLRSAYSGLLEGAA